MNLQEALEKMKQGEKLTHPCFAPDEFVTVNNGQFIDECGVVIGDFPNIIESMNNDYHKHSWSIFKEPIPAEFNNDCNTGGFQL